MDWLIDWLIDGLIDCLLDWLIDWLIDWWIDWLSFLRPYKGSFIFLQRLPSVFFSRWKNGPELRSMSYGLWTAVRPRPAPWIHWRNSRSNSTRQRIVFWPDHRESKCRQWWGRKSFRLTKSSNFSSYPFSPAIRSPCWVSAGNLAMVCLQNCPVAGRTSPAVQPPFWTWYTPAWRQIRRPRMPKFWPDELRRISRFSPSPRAPGKSHSSRLLHGFVL